MRPITLTSMAIICRFLRCNGRLVMITFSHADISLAGPCHSAQLAANHDELTVQVASGATLEVTGNHDDVWWQLAPGQVPPTTVDRGGTTIFHREREEAT